MASSGSTRFLACERRENALPNGSTVTSLVPTGYPGGAATFVANVIGALGNPGGAVPGFGITNLPSNLLSLACTATVGPYVGQTVGSIAAPLLAGFSFPSPGCHPSLTDAMSLCSQITQLYTQVNAFAPSCFNPP